MVKRFPLLLLAALPGCATIWMGPTQDVAFETNPPGATCTVDRGRVRLGTVAATPGVLRLDRDGKDIWVTCGKSGYSTVDWRGQSSFNGVTLGNLAIGGAIGLTVDAVSGADFNYADVIRLELPLLPRPPSVLAETTLPRPLHHGRALHQATPVKLAAAPGTVGE